MHPLRQFQPMLPWMSGIAQKVDSRKVSQGGWARLTTSWLAGDGLIGNLKNTAPPSRPDGQTVEDGMESCYRALLEFRGVAGNTCLIRPGCQANWNPEETIHGTEPIPDCPRCINDVWRR